MRYFPTASTAVFVALCLIWGSTWLAIKAGLRYLPPFTFAGLSFALSSVCLVVLVKLLHKRLPRDWSSWRVMVFLGLTMMGAGFAFQYWGEQYISSGLAAILFATTPLFVIIFAHILIREEKITRWRTIGIIVAFVGLIAIFWRQLTPEFGWNGEVSLSGAIAEVASGATTALAIVVYKRFFAAIDRVVNLLVQAMIGSVFLLLLGVVWERSSALDLTPLAIVAIIYLGLATTLPFIGYYWLLEQSSAINLSTITFVTPILALALGFMVLGEQVTEGTVLGGALILIGVYLTLRKNDRELVA